MSRRDRLFAFEKPPLRYWESRYSRVKGDRSALAFIKLALRKPMHPKESLVYTTGLVSCVICRSLHIITEV